MWLFSQGIEPPEKFINYPVIFIMLENLDENISWIPSDDIIDMVGGLNS
jgi:hypothetical protein